jgi:hypothetical protein
MVRSFDFDRACRDHPFSGQGRIGLGARDVERGPLVVHSHEFLVLNASRRRERIGKRRRDARFCDGREEAADDVRAVAIPDAGETGVVGERLRRAVAHGSPPAQPVGDDPHEPAFGTQSGEEQNRLGLENDDRVDRWSPAARGALPDQITNKAKIERAVEATITMARRDEVIQ